MKLQPGDLIDPDDIARAKGRSPHARQTCPGSLVQVNDIDVGPKLLEVKCPKCLKPFKAGTYTTQKNRAELHPIIPGHLPEPKGRAIVEHEEARRRTQSDTPRPW